MIDYKEIFDSWKNSFNPTAAQEELAQKRLDVCLNCDFRKEALKGVKWSAYCGDCGCPLNKKVFSKKYNPCTKGYFKDVDLGYIKPQPSKDKNTLI